MTTRTTGSPTSTDTAAARPLRTWQRRALTRYLTDRPKDFLAVATPGAGKTTFALKVAAELLGDRSVDTVTIVCPTEHLKHQWAEAAGAAGLAIDPEFSNAVGRTSTDFRGVAVTYAQVAAHPVLHMNRTEGRRTLVIFDEIHHAGDAKSWGEATREAFAGATRRLALTGTPFRSRRQPDPVHRLRARQRRGAALPGRPLLRLRRRAGRRGRAPGRLPRVLGPGELAHQRGRGDDRPPRRAPHRRAERPRLEDRARPQGRVDARRAPGRRHPPDTAARRGRPRRRRARHRHRPHDGQGLRRAAAPHRGRGARRRALRRPEGLRAHRGVRAHERPLAGRRPHGLRGRRRPAAGRRRLRHQRLDPAVLRAGRRPLRALAAARGDRERLPARACRRCSRWPASSRCSATTSSASRTGRRRAGRTTSSRRPTAPRTSRASRRRRSSRCPPRPSSTS